MGEAAATDFLAKLAAAADDAAKAVVLADYGAAASAANGWLFNKGAIDFAGGTVVHINAGVAGLVCAIVLGKRVGIGQGTDGAAQPDRDADRHRPPLVRLVRLQRRLQPRSQFADRAGVPQHHHRDSGGDAGLDARRMGAARPSLASRRGLGRGRGPRGRDARLRLGLARCGASFIGLVAGLVCLWAVVWLKKSFGYDDALDVFGVHGVGGIVGALLTGVFVNPAWNGVGVTDYAAIDTSVKVLDYSFSGQMYSQIVGVLTAVVLSGVVSFIALMICKVTVGLRVTSSRSAKASTSRPTENALTPDVHKTRVYETGKVPQKGAFLFTRELDTPVIAKREK